MNVFLKKSLLSIFILFCMLIMLLYYNRQSKASKTVYMLKSYKNTIALYKDEEIIKLYNDIVLNTLSSNDIQNFTNGLSFSSPSQAENYLLDFD